MRWRAATRVLVIVTLGVAPATARAQEERPFLVTVTASGAFEVDYGEERKEPGRTRGVGLDGKEFGSFKWELKVVARGALLQTVAAIGRMSFSHGSDVVNWTMSGGQLSEKPACRMAGGPIAPSFPGSMRQTWAGKAGVFTRAGDWVRDSSARVSKDRRGLFVDHPWETDVAGGCHPDLHRLKFLGGADSTDLRMARNEWSARGRGRFRQTYRDRITRPPDHEAEANSFHTFDGASELTVDIKGMSEKNARERTRDYRKHPRHQTLPFEDPS